MPRRSKELDLSAVAERINAVGKRHKVRWTISPHTAEMAIAAFARPERAPRRGPPAKGRRSKRTKRLL